MPSLPAILLGALLAEGTCAPHDSEDNVCLLALNSTRSKANASLAAAVSGDLSNTTDLSLAGGSTQRGTGATLGTLVEAEAAAAAAAEDAAAAAANQRGTGATLGTLVSDYVRSARSASNRSASNRSATAETQVQHPELHSSAEAHAAMEATLGTHSAAEAKPERPAPPEKKDLATEAESAPEETHGEAEAGVHTSFGTQLAPEFEQRIRESKSKSAAEKNRDAHFTGKTPPQSPGQSFTLNTNALPFGKTSGQDFTGKGSVKNPVADQLHMAKQMAFEPGVSTSSLSSSATDLQTVLEAMYKLGRLIKRMPDDKLETRKETPSPTPPPYAFARRFDPFGQGTSSI